MKKILIWIVGILAVICLVAVLLVNSWRETGHGKLNYKIAIVLKLMKLTAEEPLELSVEKGRENLEKLAGSMTGDKVPLQSVVNRTIPGPAGEIPVRIYHPDKTRILPVLIFYHGGGWVQGNLNSHDNLVRYLAVKTGAVAVSVDYRLAPEHPFPAGVEDCYAALTWVAENAESFGGDPERIAVMGDSAGGNLSAVVSLLARDRNGPVISRQVLVYPATNLKKLDTDSYNYFAKGFMLTRDKIVWFREQYLTDPDDWGNPMASPLLAEDHHHLPPATIFTGEMDPLRDDGKLYADKLEQAGVEVNYRCFKGMIHGFVSADRVLSQAHEALDEAAADLQKSFGTPP